MADDTSSLDDDIVRLIEEKAELDLPSRKDTDALKDAITEEHGSFVYRRYNETTDLATLTGKHKYSKYFYLSDKPDNDEFTIYYEDENGAIRHEDFVEKDKLKNYNRYSRQFVIRPVLRFNNCPELFDHLQFPKTDRHGKKLKYSKIKFGWMPRYIPDKSTQYKLNIAYKSHKIIKTNDEYTFDSRYVRGDGSIKQKFKPIAYPVYEFENKKYIRYQVNQCWDSRIFVDKMIGVKSEPVILSNNLAYTNGEYVWVEVSQIPWIVDIERKTLIAEEGLLSGIQFDSFDANYQPINYETSFIKKFLNNYLKGEILKNEHILVKGKNKQQNTSEENKNNDQVTSLLNKIQEYRKYYFGTMNIEEKVKKLLSNYNMALDKLSRKIDQGNNELSIETSNPKLLYQRLILDLEEILMELKIHGEKVKNYHDMIDILTECIKNEVDPNKDELCTTIHTIKSVILEFIPNPKIKSQLKKELNDIIANNINRNKAYIEEFKHNDGIKNKSLEELKLEFKRDLQPFLENRLVKVIENQDLVNEIMNNVKSMIDNHFTESKNKMVRNYLSILNDIISRIKDIGTNEDRERVRQIVGLDFNIDDDINLIMRKLEAMIKEAYKIQLDIEERIAKNKEIDDLRVNVDISNIFNDNNKNK